MRGRRVGNWLPMLSPRAIVARFWWKGQEQVLPRFWEPVLHFPKTIHAVKYLAEWRCKSMSDGTPSQLLKLYAYTHIMEYLVATYKISYDVTQHIIHLFFLILSLFMLIVLSKTLIYQSRVNPRFLIIDLGGEKVLIVKFWTIESMSKKPMVPSKLVY